MRNTWFIVGDLVFIVLCCMAFQQESVIRDAMGECDLLSLSIDVVGSAGNICVQTSSLDSRYLSCRFVLAGGGSATSAWGSGFHEGFVLPRMVETP